MNKINDDKHITIARTVSSYFKAQRISYSEVADRLGYKNIAIVRNYMSRGQFGERAADRWAREFGFNPNFLMHGKGKLIVATSGYQKMKRENEILRSIILAQRKQIKSLSKSGHSSL